MLGLRFGRLVVAALAGIDSGRSALWGCRCDCGATTTVRGTHLRQGITKSCGCLSKEIARATHTRHGLGTTRVYAIWEAMHARCRDHPHYGGRGIRVCSAWSSFEQFLADMGTPSPGLSIDRIDNNGNYEPSNCRWATKREQANNTRGNRMECGFGRELTLAEWARELGVTYEALRGQLRRGRSVEQAASHIRSRQGLAA